MDRLTNDQPLTAPFNMLCSSRDVWTFVVTEIWKLHELNGPYGHFCVHIWTQSRMYCGRFYQKTIGNDVDILEYQAQCRLLFCHKHVCGNCFSSAFSVVGFTTYYIFLINKISSVYENYLQILSQKIKQ